MANVTQLLLSLEALYQESENLFAQLYIHFELPLILAEYAEVDNMLPGCELVTGAEILSMVTRDHWLKGNYDYDGCDSLKMRNIHTVQ